MQDEKRWVTRQLVMQHVLAAMSAPGSFLLRQPFTCAANATTTSALAKPEFFFCSLFACISKPADSYYTVSPGRQSPRTGWCGCRRASSPASPPTCIVASLVCGSTFLLGAAPVRCIFLKLHTNKKTTKRAVAHFLCTPLCLPPCALCRTSLCILRKSEPCPTTRHQ